MEQAKSTGIIAEIFDAVSDFNGRYFRTIKALILQPQQVVETMLADPANKRYVSPFRFALLTYTLFAFVSAYLELNMVNLGMALVEGEASEFIEKLFLITDQGLVAYSFISLIPLGWFTAKLFSKSGKGNLDCYKISLYSYSLGTFMIVAIVTPISLINTNMSVDTKLSMYQYTSLVTVAYSIWVLKQCFSVSLWEGTWKGLLSFVWYYFMNFILMVIFMAMIAGYLIFTQ